ncbi:hypothetical protein U1E44_11595 [Arenibacter sp. GZD96]|uniref:anti-sigma factor family protein n=1 Tax=Aurantibrevibacter litoralis TaxID=3106030 RepID=UPI002AFFAA1F|nr:hypothetical protein [Arenibacter sp. GZD-96]MEA1786739.1 hypothetical protein [Arenibacter sp. GZD-96]
MIPRIMNMLFLSCKQATALVEKKQVTTLSLLERIQLKMHIWMCSACRSYEKQSLLMNSLMQRMVSRSKEELNHMDEAAKKKVLQQIKDCA